MIWWHFPKIDSCNITDLLRGGPEILSQKEILQVGRTSGNVPGGLFCLERDIHR